MNFWEKFKFLNKHQIIFDLGRKKLFQKTEWKWNQCENSKKVKASNTKKTLFQTSKSAKKIVTRRTIARNSNLKRGIKVQKIKFALKILTRCTVKEARIKTFLAQKIVTRNFLKFGFQARDNSCRWIERQPHFDRSCHAEHGGSGLDMYLIFPAADVVEESYLVRPIP